MLFVFFFQSEDGIRGLVRSRGLGDVYKRQTYYNPDYLVIYPGHFEIHEVKGFWRDDARVKIKVCLLYTSDAADDLLCVDLGGRRIIEKKQKLPQTDNQLYIIPI